MNLFRFGALILSLCILAPLANARREKPRIRENAPCQEIKCAKKGQADRAACRKERRACLQKHFEGELAKMKTEGVRPIRKQKLIERMTQRLERTKEQKAELEDMIESLEKHLGEVKQLPEKTGAPKN